MIKQRQIKSVTTVRFTQLVEWLQKDYKELANLLRDHEILGWTSLSYMGRQIYWFGIVTDDGLTEREESIRFSEREIIATIAKRVELGRLEEVLSYYDEDKEERLVKIKHSFS